MTFAVVAMEISPAGSVFTHLAKQEIKLWEKFFLIKRQCNCTKKNNIKICMNTYLKSDQ